MGLATDTISIQGDKYYGIITTNLLWRGLSIGET